MSQYLILNRLQVQNANCIAGFTWGFPAITHFLGFTHNLHRKISDAFDVTLGGCAVICHDYNLHCYQPYQERGDFEFIQSKNPPYLPEHNLEGNAPIIEEGRMNLTVSLIISLDKEFVGDDAKKTQFEDLVTEVCTFGRLAGGTILSIKSAQLSSARTDSEKQKFNSKLKRNLMPGFVLKDRSDVLEKHFHQLKLDNENVELIDAWLDFSALKYQAIPKLAKDEEILTEKTDAEWLRCNKPVSKGWLVPIIAGYKAISPVYKPGQVSNARDETVPSCFVESVHTVGEWMSLHRVTDINMAIWTYFVDEEWYLCKQKFDETQDKISTTADRQKLSFETALQSI